MEADPESDRETASCPKTSPAWSRLQNWKAPTDCTRAGGLRLKANGGSVWNLECSLQTHDAVSYASVPVN